MIRTPVVRYRSETDETPCPYGNVQRIVTGGEGGVANVHVVSVTQGDAHLHKGYDEVYYVLSGNGTITMDKDDYALKPGAVVTIPAGMPHALSSGTDAPLEFIIFGTPPMGMDDERAKPIKP
ncbi:MAG: cupin domain-containing protein [Desulfosarcina sp.]|nr:cupin domain-containing protein [Desulfosarcina sp.]MBC2744021.1 cupin domain-containing protein [Desulfosarcina sp.]MBC2766931.1 cupin domain-containing protein [Desulfosarcina sp.]